MSGRIWDWFVTPAGATTSTVVLDGSITVDSTRNPQVSASLKVPFTTWTAAKLFDPFTRAHAIIEVRYSAVAAGPLSAFGAGSAPGTLASLDWSNKASNPQSLGGDATPIGQRVRRIHLYVTDVTVDETAGTMNVSLASADFLLTELINFGSDWMPRPGGSPGGVFQWSLDDVWGEFFRTFLVPLSLQAALQSPTTGIAWRNEMEPWRTGENAWSWLNAVRTHVPGQRYLIDTKMNQVDFADLPLPRIIPQRNGSTSIAARRSVEGFAEGQNQYADAVMIRYRDRTDANRPDRLFFANAHGDWRLMRRAYIEERDLPTAWEPPDLAEARVGFMKNFQRVTTIRRPIDIRHAPFRDLFDIADRVPVQSMVYNYGAADVTTTYLETD
ncbi:hypothetical protein [Agrococcus jejuensis]|uniref:hypothetical protein n=1 Tax=Agrococcus jejuensis TaxID=399736 RepID=UPI00119E573C|nr:hypothetical protein [Agrococcus jejuensis]